MKNILISASLEESAENFLGAVQAMLEDCGCSVQTVRTENGIALFAVQPPPKELASPAPIEQPTVSSPSELPVPELDVVLTTGTVDLQVPQQPVLSPSDAKTLDGMVTIKSLSMTNQVPFKYDSTFPSSILIVSGVTPVGDMVEFNYCGTTFKYPVEREGSDTVFCNESPTFTDKSIRVILTFDGTTNYPVLLSVTDTRDSSCPGETCVVLGKDLQEMIETLPAA